MCVWVKIRAILGTYKTLFENTTCQNNCYVFIGDNCNWKIIFDYGQMTNTLHLKQCFYMHILMAFNLILTLRNLNKLFN